MTIDSPLKAIELGIGMVSAFYAIPAFKTWENVVLGLTDEQKIYWTKRCEREKDHPYRQGNITFRLIPMQISYLSVGLQQQVRDLESALPGLQVVNFR